MRQDHIGQDGRIDVGDTGLACALLGLDGPALWKDREALGQLLETFVYQELRRQSDGGATPTRFHHFRDKEGIEVDIIADRGAIGLVGIEVKASATITLKDFRGLKKLKEDAGHRFKAGVVVYDGETCVSVPSGTTPSRSTCNVPMDRPRRLILRPLGACWRRSGASSFTTS